LAAFRAAGYPTPRASAAVPGAGGAGGLGSAVCRDLAPQAAVIVYPTNFAAMAESDKLHLTTRGEQLVQPLLEHYCPDLPG
jgi:hypothetical protein